MAAPFIIQRQQVALKIESTEGTDAVPVDADVIAPVFDVEFTPTFEVFERDNVQASFSRLPQIQGERSAVISFSTEIKGSGTAGTAPANLSAPLLAAGFGETIVTSTSVTYAPASASLSSATVEIREGAVGTEFMQKKIVGARGTVVFEGVKGDIVLARFTFTGRYVEPTNTAISAFTTPSPGQTPESFLNATLSFQGAASLKVQNVNLDIGNDVQMRNDVNQATGNFSALIVNRAPTGSIDPEQELVATINFFNQLTTNAEGVLSYILGSTAGNISTFNAPKAQIINATEADRNGIRILNLDLQLNQSAAAGDDELTLVFT